MDDFTVAYERKLRLQIEALISALSVCSHPNHATALQQVIDGKCAELEKVRPPLDDPNSQAPKEIAADTPGANVEQTALIALAAVNGVQDTRVPDELRGWDAIIPSEGVPPTPQTAEETNPNPCHGSYGTLNYV